MNFNYLSKYLKLINKIRNIYVNYKFINSIYKYICKYIVYMM